MRQFAHTSPPPPSGRPLADGRRLIPRLRLEMGPLVLLAVLASIINGLIANYWMNAYAKKKVAKIRPLEKTEPHDHSSREGFSGKPNRLYIIYGGSGFIGSWFARYLLLRKEVVIIIDKIRPPADVLRHQAHFYESPMNNNKLMGETLREIISIYWKDNPELIIYNCVCERRYPQVRHHSLYDPGLRSTEVLIMAMPAYLYPSLTVINVGDTICERTPVHWMRWWDRNQWIQKSPRDDGPRTEFGLMSKREVATIYGWYQGFIEALTLKTCIVSASIRSEGFVVGHLGDNQLSNAIFNGFGYLHNWGVPMNFLHVEDFVRAGLALEYKLLDPETRNDFNKQVFSISGAEPTTLEYVYDYIKERRPFKVVKVYPIVAWCIGWVASFLTMLFSTESYNPGACVFSGPPSSLTQARLFTVQACHRRNRRNVHRCKELLKYSPKYHSVGPILDDLLNEVEAMEKHQQIKAKNKKD